MPKTEQDSNLKKSSRSTPYTPFKPSPILGGRTYSVPNCYSPVYESKSYEATGLNETVVLETGSAQKTAQNSYFTDYTPQRPSRFVSGVNLSKKFTEIAESAESQEAESEASPDLLAVSRKRQRNLEDLEENCNKKVNLRPELSPRSKMAQKVLKSDGTVNLVELAKMIAGVQANSEENKDFLNGIEQKVENAVKKEVQVLSTKIDGIDSRQKNFEEATKTYQTNMEAVIRKMESRIQLLEGGAGPSGSMISRAQKEKDEKKSARELIIKGVPEAKDEDSLCLEICKYLKKLIGKDLAHEIIWNKNERSKNTLLKVSRQKRSENYAGDKNVPPLVFITLKTKELVDSVMVGAESICDDRIFKATPNYVRDHNAFMAARRDELNLDAEPGYSFKLVGGPLKRLVKTKNFAQKNGGEQQTLKDLQNKIDLLSSKLMDKQLIEQELRAQLEACGAAEINGNQ